MRWAETREGAMQKVGRLLGRDAVSELVYFSC